MNDVTSRSELSIAQLDRAISDEIQPSTAEEVSLVGVLAQRLWALRERPEIEQALSTWLRSLPDHSDARTNGEPSALAPLSTNGPVGDPGARLNLAFPGNFLLAAYVPADPEYDGHVSTERAALVMAFEPLFSGDFTDRLSDEELVHVERYRAAAQRLWELIDQRRPGTPVEEWIWDSQLAAILAILRT